MPVPGSNIRALRLQMGLSVRALAKAAGMNNGNLSKLEAGKIGYSDDVLEKLAKILGVSYGALFAEPEKLESAALRTRSVPILTDQDIVRWQGSDDAEFDDNQEFLQVSIQRSSRFAFAIRVVDELNLPEVRPGDEIVFDPKISPSNHDWVVGEDGKGHVVMGRIQLITKSEFILSPTNPGGDGHLIYSRMNTGHRLIATAIEHRRILK